MGLNKRIDHKYCFLAENLNWDQRYYRRLGNLLKLFLGETVRQNITSIYFFFRNTILVTVDQRGFRTQPK